MSNSSAAIICFYNEDVSYRLAHKKKIRQWLLSIIEQEGKTSGAISYIFCSDEYLAEINAKYLNASYFTDVITFDYTENDCVSGDIFISIDRVKDNAKLYNQSCCRELLRVILHGVLHLCGYKDKTTNEAAEMREKEEHYLQKFI
ncbi:MAG: rRNA maturation RNase YbeY [Bacteroidales bacterium]|jgi:rRNA maturation RNase YbeY|nr:rRNA maturation RNase YbeY [Bacteroidales bacterium]